MRILLNATDGPLSLRAVRRYVLELASGLADPGSGVDLDLVFFTHRLGRVRRFLRLLPEGARFRTRAIPLPRRLLNQRHRHPRPELRWLAREADLYHETTNDNPRFEGLPVLTTIHGICPLVRPDICEPAFIEKKTAWLERAVATSDYFTTVSETSRGELLSHFPQIPPHTVRTIPLGVSSIFHPLPADEARAEVHGYFGIREPYLLYVGGIQKNKNVAMVLRVFRRLRERRAFHGKLVLAGDLHYDEHTFTRMLDEEGIREHVVLPGCFLPEDPRLAALYRGAHLFLFPSFYEGWTSPPLEAMACGTPVVASNASSIPETVGDAARLADPEDENAWVEAAHGILDDPELTEELTARGLARAAEFPWSRAVAANIALYSDILEGRLDTEPPSTTRKARTATGGKVTVASERGRVSA